MVATLASSSALFHKEVAVREACCLSVLELFDVGQLSEVLKHDERNVFDKLVEGLMVAAAQRNGEVPPAADVPGGPLGVAAAASAVNSLRFIRAMDDDFEARIGRLPSWLQRIYAETFSAARAESKASSSASSPSSASEDFADPEDYDVHHKQLKGLTSEFGSKVSQEAEATVASFIRQASSNAIESLPARAQCSTPEGIKVRRRTMPDPEMETATDPLSSILPAHLLTELRDMDPSAWKARTEATASFLEIIVDMRRPDDLERLRGATRNLLELLTLLLDDQNFKVSMTTLKIISALVKKIGPSISRHLPALLPNLVGKLGSSKVLIRQACIRPVFCDILMYVHVLALGKLLVPFFIHKNWRTRQALLHIIIIGLLELKREADSANYGRVKNGDRKLRAEDRTAEAESGETVHTLNFLLSKLCPLLRDVHARVAHAALEATFVIHHRRHSRAFGLTPEDGHVIDVVATLERSGAARGPSSS